MTNGFEEAKLHRNWLERLVDKVPGFRGYQNRELRRDVDRLQREHLAKELGGLKTVVRMKAREYTDEGQIGMLHLFERRFSMISRPFSGSWRRCLPRGRRIRVRLSTGHWTGSQSFEASGPSARTW
jgi:hypothetical protein